MSKKQNTVLFILLYRRKSWDHYRKVDLISFVHNRLMHLDTDEYIDINKHRVHALAVWHRACNYRAWVRLIAGKSIDKTGTKLGRYALNSQHYTPRANEDAFWKENNTWKIWVYKNYYHTEFFSDSCIKKPDCT